MNAITETNKKEGSCELATIPAPLFKPSYSSHYDEDSWRVSVDLPGVKKSDIDVVVENEILELTAFRRDEIPEEWKPLGEYSMSRRYRLRLDVGPEVDPAGVEATLENGVLALQLPLREETKPIRVKIS